MIRWYDYTLAVVAADWILGMMLWGFNATEWWEPMVAGLLAGMVIKVWEEQYCYFRLKQERNRGK
jgi:hypothetical protein